MQCVDLTENDSDEERDIKPLLRMAKKKLQATIKQESTAKPIPVPTTNKTTPSAAVTCTLCTETCESFDQLEIHICVDHLQWCRYECMMCSYARFPTEFTVQHHFNQIHGGTDPKVVQSFNAEKSEYVRAALQAAIDRMSGDVATTSWQPTPQFSSTPMDNTSQASFPRPARDDEMISEMETSDGRSKQQSLTEETDDDETNMSDVEMEDRTIQCVQCDEAIAIKNLRAHIWRSHMDCSRLQCPYCDYAQNSVQRTKMELHVRTLHEGLRIRYVDNDTRKAADFDRNWRNCGFPEVRLMKLRKDAPVKTDTNSALCMLCKKRFMIGYRSRNAKTHAMTHMKVRQYQCGECDFTSPNQRPVRRHARSKHPLVSHGVARIRNNYANESAIKELRELRAKAFPKLFTVFHTDQREVPDMKNEDSVMCQMCEPATRHFKLKAEKHVWAHITEKPFTCGHCKTQFSGKSNVGTHSKRFHETEEIKIEDNRVKLQKKIAKLTNSCFPNFSLSEAERKALEDKSNDRTFRSNTNSASPSTCSRCNIVVTNVSNHVYQHLSKDCGASRFSCKIDNCRYKTSAKNSIVSHLKHLHKTIIGAMDNPNYSELYDDHEDALRPQYDTIMQSCFGH